MVGSNGICFCLREVVGFVCEGDEEGSGKEKKKDHGV